MNTYVDFATIRKHGDLVKMWQLYDFKKIRQQKDSSIYPQKIKLNTTVKKSKRGLRLTHGSLAIWVMGMLFILALNTVNGIPFNLEVLAKRFLKSPAA